MEEGLRGDGGADGHHPGDLERADQHRKDTGFGLLPRQRDRLRRGVLLGDVWDGQRVLAKSPGGHLFWIFLVGTGLAACVAFVQPITHAHVTWQSVAALAYLGLLGTGLAYVFLAKGLAHLEAATAGILNSLLPVFTLVQAHYFLHEPITVYLLGGAACVMGAVMLILGHQRRWGCE